MHKYRFVLLGLLDLPRDVFQFLLHPVLDVCVLQQYLVHFLAALALLGRFDGLRVLVLECLDLFVVETEG